MIGKTTYENILEGLVSSPRGMQQISCKLTELVINRIQSECIVLHDIEEMRDLIDTTALQLFISELSSVNYNLDNVGMNVRIEGHGGFNITKEELKESKVWQPTLKVLEAFVAHSMSNKKYSARFLIIKGIIKSYLDSKFQEKEFSVLEERILMPEYFKIAKDMDWLDFHEFILFLPKSNISSRLNFILLYGDKINFEKFKKLAKHKESGFKAANAFKKFMLFGYNLVRDEIFFLKTTSFSIIDVFQAIYLLKPHFEELNSILNQTVFTENPDLHLQNQGRYQIS